MTDRIIYRFSDLIAQAEGGKLDADLEAAITDLIGDLHNAGEGTGGRAKGSVTVKIDFALDGGAITLGNSFVVKRPKLVRTTTIFWATPNNHLTLVDPRQDELNLPVAEHHAHDTKRGGRPKPAMRDADRAPEA